MDERLSAAAAVPSQGGNCAEASVMRRYVMSKTKRGLQQTKTRSLTATEVRVVTTVPEAIAELQAVASTLPKFQFEERELICANDLLAALQARLRKEQQRGFQYLHRKVMNYRKRAAAR